MNRSDIKLRKKCFLISSRQDLDDFYPLFDSDSFVIAWSEEGVHQLRERGVSYFVLSDFLEKDVEIDFIYEKYRVYRKFISSVEKWIQGKAKSNDFFCFESQTHSMRLPFFVYAYELDKLHYFVTHFDMSDLYGSVQIGSLTLSELISHWNLSIRVHGSSKRSNLALNPKWYSRNGFFKILGKKILRKTPYKSWRSLLTSFFQFSFFFNSKPFYIVHSVDWTHDQIVRGLNKKFNVLFFEDFIWKAKVSKRWSHFFTQLSSSLDLREKGPRYQGVFVVDLMRDEIKNFLNHQASKVQAIERTTREVIQLFDVQFMFTSYYLIETEVIHHILKRLCLPSFFMLHGGTTGVIRGSGFTPFSARIGDDHQCHFLLYSKMVRSDFEYAKSKLHELTCQTAEVGDVYFHRLLERSGPLLPLKKRSPLRICYIYAGTGPYNALFKWGAMEDASLVDLRYRLLEILEQSMGQNVEWTFKFGYGVENQDSFLENKMKSSQHVKWIGSDQKLLDHVDEFDLFVTELPSTSLLELMALNKRVLCLLDRKTIEVCQAAHPDFENSIYPSDSTSDFLSQIKKIVTHPGGWPELKREPQVFAQKFIEKARFPDPVRSVTEYIEGVIVNRG